MKQIVRITESDLTRIVIQIIKEESSNDSKKNLIISQNNKSVNYIKNKYLSDAGIDGTIKRIIKSAVEKFGNKINAKAPTIVSQMLSSDGAGSASTYIETLKDSIYNTVNGISWGEKTLLNQLVSKEEFKKLMDNNNGVINNLITVLTINNFLKMHDMNKPNEGLWYDRAYDSANSRIDGVRKHLVDWITKQLFG